MPELPEVETIVRNLRDGHPRDIRWIQPSQAQIDQKGVQEARADYVATASRPPSIVGLRITHAKLLWMKTLAEPAEEAFYERVTGQVVRDITRRGKYLVFQLEDEYLLVHLRMSGDLLVEKADEPVAKHHRLLLFFDNGLRLAFNDTRKFGRVWLVTDPESVVGKLGPEPLSDDFTADDFAARLQGRKRQLKPLILDQTFLAGVGNIYTDEALFRAKLHPEQQADSVSEAEAKALWQAIRDVLNDGIQNNGASIDWVYRGGEFQMHFNAYGQTGEPCPRCGTPIERIVVGQRGTHICPKCQRNY